MKKIEKIMSYVSILMSFGVSIYILAINEPSIWAFGWALYAAAGILMFFAIRKIDKLEAKYNALADDHINHLKESTNMCIEAKKTIDVLLQERQNIIGKLDSANKISENKTMKN